MACLQSYNSIRMLGGRQEGGGSVAGLVVVVEAGAVKLSQVSQLRVRAITQPVLGLHPPHHTRGK